MAADLAGAVRTAVDEARRLAQQCGTKEWFATFYSPMDEWRVRDKASAGQVVEIIADDDVAEAVAEHIAFWEPRRALAMCDWADDVLRRHVGYAIPRGYDAPARRTAASATATSSHAPK